MDPILKLQAERDERRTKIRAMLNAAKNADRDLSTDEKNAIDIEAHALEAVETKLAEEYKQLEHDRHHAVAIMGPEGWNAPAKREQGAVGNLSFRALFGDPRGDAHFPKGEDFYAAVASGRFHPGLIRAQMNEHLGSEGGFLVPDQLTAEAFDAAVEDSVFLPRCRVYPMETETRSLAGFSADGNATYGPYGSWAPDWVAEGGTIGVSEPHVRKVELKAWKLALYITVSNELLADGLSFSNQLGGAMRKALSWALDSAIVNGNGAGKPIGIMTAPATITVAKENGQTAATFVAANALKMYARMLPAGHRNAAWFVHPSVLPQLYSMTVLAGVAGQAMGGLPGYFDASAMTLFGRPVLVSEKLAALGSVGDVIFADLSFYALGVRKQITLDQSNAPGFQTDTMAFRGIVRADGKPLLSQAYTPKVGDTLSPFVTIAARA